MNAIQGPPRELLYVDGHRERREVTMDRRFVHQVSPMVVNDFMRRRTVRS